MEATKQQMNDFTPYWIARKTPTLENVQTALRTIKPYHMPTHWTAQDVRHNEMTRDALDWLYRTFDKMTGIKE